MHGKSARTVLRGGGEGDLTSLPDRSRCVSVTRLQPTRGQTPRNFAVDPTGSYVLAENMRSNTIVVLRVDPASSALSLTGQVVEVRSPVCVKFVPIPK
jgi:6-phosphogluconolactonase (cycloisomerase 2 family)